MSAVLLDGKALAASIEEELKARVARLDAKGLRPGLAVIRVGEDAASAAYVARKEKACARVGIHSVQYAFDAGISMGELLQTIDLLNRDGDIHGILLQLPLPAMLEARPLLEAIAPEKDVDGLKAIHLGKVFQGEQGFVPCTPKGISRLLKAYDLPVEGKDVVIAGRSDLLGKPMAALMLEENATVTLCHSRTACLAAHTRRADLLIVGINQPMYITPDMVQEGAIVIDAGIHRMDGKIRGDVHPDVLAKAAYMTPVPGGVGPMTVAMLLENTIEAAEKQLDQGV